jgi:hypothetical protein
MKKWFVAGASITGESHIRRGRGNDDALAICQQDHWTAIVVSDGAGSSIRAQEGAHFVSEGFRIKLLSIATLLDELGPGPWLNDSVINAVLEVRSDLASVAGSYDLKDFHCTLVAALFSCKGGFTVHIGDGAIIVGRNTDSDDIEVEIHSPPENGEYANETFFITETTWLKNIRIKPLANFEWIALTTDGAASIFLDRAVKEEAIESLFQILSEMSAETSFSKLIEFYLDSEDARYCSDDDKTLAIAYKNESMLSLFTDLGSMSVWPTNDQILPNEDKAKKESFFNCDGGKNPFYNPHIKGIKLLPARFVPILLSSVILAFFIFIFMKYLFFIQPMVQNFKQPNSSQNLEEQDFDSGASQ